MSKKPLAQRVLLLLLHVRTFHRKKERDPALFEPFSASKRRRYSFEGTAPFTTLLYKKNKFKLGNLEKSIDRNMPPRRCRIRARIIRKLYQFAHHRKPPTFVTWRNDRTRIWTFLLNTTARFVRFRFALFQRLPSSPVRFRFFSQQGLIYLHGYPSPAAECLRESCRTKKSIIHCRPTHTVTSANPPIAPGGVVWCGSATYLQRERAFECVLGPAVRSARSRPQRGTPKASRRRVLQQGNFVFCTPLLGYTGLDFAGYFDSHIDLFCVHALDRHMVLRHLRPVFGDRVVKTAVGCVRKHLVWKIF